MDTVELVNLKRLAHILKGLSPAELETLEILLDKEALKTIGQSLKELQEGNGVPLRVCEKIGTVALADGEPQLWGSNFFTASQ